MVYFHPSRTIKMVFNLRLLEGVKDGGESFHPRLNLYSTRRGRKKKKAMEFNQSTWLSLHVCYILNAPIVTSSLRHGNSPTSKPVCMRVLKFQTKLLSMLKMTLKFQKQNTWLDVNFAKVLFISPTHISECLKLLG